MRRPEVKVTSTHVLKLEIKAPGCDPINIYAEDHRPGCGAIVIRSWTKAWAAGWGGMGDRKILEFFASCDAHYLLKNLVPHEERFETDIAGTIDRLKRDLCMWRKGESIGKEEARQLWDNHIAPLSPDMQDWELFSAMSEMPRELIEDATTKKLTSDAENLRDNIIPAIWSAIAKLKRLQQETQAAPSTCEWRKHRMISLSHPTEPHTRIVGFAIPNEPGAQFFLPCDQLEKIIGPSAPTAAAAVPAEDYAIAVLERNTAQKLLADAEAELTRLRSQAGAVPSKPLAWGVPNSRPTESNPLMQVLLDISSAQYPELLIPLYAAPIVDANKGGVPEGFEIVPPAGRGPIKAIVLKGPTGQRFEVTNVSYGLELFVFQLANAILLSASPAAPVAADFIDESAKEIPAGILLLARAEQAEEELRCADERAQELEELIDFITPAVPVMRNIFRTAGLTHGVNKAEEMMVALTDRKADGPTHPYKLCGCDFPFCAGGCGIPADGKGGEAPHDDGGITEGDMIGGDA